MAVFLYYYLNIKINYKVLEKSKAIVAQRLLVIN